MVKHLPLYNTQSLLMNIAFTILIDGATAQRLQTSDAHARLID